MTMITFLGISLPNILSNDALKNNGECNIVIPKNNLEMYSVDVASLMTVATDVQFVKIETTT